MFTGIVEEVGTVKSVVRQANSAVLTVGARVVLEGLRVGDSVATNGVCLTVTSFDGGSFTADVMHETLNRSSLGALKPGSLVNLERAMAANGRFGGHMVSGHIDGVGTVQRITPDSNAIWYQISAGPQLMRYVVEKGSVALDGISLTVAQVTAGSFSVSIIPHTQGATNLGSKKVGDPINIENDVVGKYVEKLLSLGLVPGASATAGAPVGEVASLGAGAAAGLGAGAASPSAAVSQSPGLSLEWLAANGF